MSDRIRGQPMLYSSHKLAGLAIQMAGHPGSPSGPLGTYMNCFMKKANEAVLETGGQWR